MTGISSIQFHVAQTMIKSLWVVKLEVDGSPLEKELTLPLPLKQS